MSRSVLALLVLALASLDGVRAQSPVEEFVVIDDMVLRPEQLAAMTSGTTNRTQAHPIDYRSRFGAWDSGVIPYQIDPDFSAIERSRILNAFQRWSQTAPLVFVSRSTQTGFLNVTRETAQPNQASPCFSNVGQTRRGAVVRTNLGDTCASSVHTIAHEIGHALGLWHEHQRSDRDNFLTIDFSNVRENAVSNFNIIVGIPLVGPYDFGSIMHYTRSSFAIDSSKPTIVPHAPFQEWSTAMGSLPDPSDFDHAAVAFLYNAQLRESTIRIPTEPVRTTFDRADFLLAMERLHALYMGRLGLHRAQGLSIAGRPDFLGIAQWIFDVYLPARASGFSAEGAFDIVIAAITRSDEWRQKNPGVGPLTPSTFTRTLSLNRDEFLEAMLRLDRFYSAPEGLQRADGLSISGGPDFLGIAAWIFDVYLNERLRGTSAAAAWTLTENAIRSTDEWRRLH